MAVRKLTEIGLEKLKPPAPGTRMELRDAIVTGLALRVTPNNVKTWSVTYRYAKKLHRITLGQYPLVSLLEARNMAKEIYLEVAKGNNPAKQREDRILEQQRLLEEAVTVETLFQQFLERHCKQRQRRWKANEQVFENHIKPAIGNIVAKELTRKEVHRLLDKLKDSKRPHAANHVLSVLRKMYNWAIERDEVIVNPCLGIKKPVPTPERERVLSRDEIKVMWEACNQLGYPYGPVCQLLLLTGQRRSEIANLKWKQIDFNEKVIRLEAEQVKAKRGHEVPLSDFAIALIQSCPRHRGSYVFTTTGGKRPINGFGKTKGCFEQHFKGKNWRFHDLRRTCATGMAELGVLPFTISRILNHAEGGVTKIYNRHSYLSEKRHALNLWAQHIRNIVHGDDGKSSNIVSLDRKKYAGEEKEIQA